MSRFLVTGGAGFIGSHLVEALLQRGHEVRVLDNLSTGRRSNIDSFLSQIEFIEGDMADANVCQRAMHGIEYVLHQAAIPSVARSVEDPVGTTQNNVIGTVNLLWAAVQCGVKRFVQAGSSSAYGDQPVEVKIETLKPQPLSPYAVAKLTQEQMGLAFSRSFSLSTMTLRYFNIFGPRQDPNSPYSAVIPLFTKALLEGKRPVIHGDGGQSRDFTYIHNVVEANLKAALTQEGAGETVNIACGTTHSVLDLLQRIASLLGVEANPEFLPPRTGDVRHSLASIEKAKALIGYEPVVSFDEGLRRTVAWFQTQLAQQG